MSLGPVGALLLVGHDPRPDEPVAQGQDLVYGADRRIARARLQARKPVYEAVEACPGAEIGHGVAPATRPSLAHSLGCVLAAVLVHVRTSISRGASQSMKTLVSSKYTRRQLSKRVREWAAVRSCSSERSPSK